MWTQCGCSRALPAGADSSSPAPPALVRSCDHQPGLNIIVDYTGSLVDAAAAEAWANLRQALPEVVESINACSVVLWAFQGDGWQWARLKELRIPSRPSPNSSSELTDFANVKRALENAETRRIRGEVVEALKPLEEVSVSPPLGHEASMSNVVGMLKRIAETKESGSVFILITDLADSKFRSLPHIDAPSTRVCAIAILVPSKPKDAVLTLGKDLPADQQFDVRSRQLRQSASWVSVLPYFSRGLLAVIKSEMGGAEAPQSSGIPPAAASPWM